ncbi:MAG: hypothetical protein IJQ02_03885 [Oscillospiraceae bacterium]|nr:hypothetical protein [Oscillospiraceae bacterium]
MIVDNTYDWLEEAVIKDMQLSYRMIALPTDRERKKLAAETVPEITRLLRGWYDEHKHWLDDGRQFEHRDDALRLLKRYKIL